MKGFLLAFLAIALFVLTTQAHDALAAECAFTPKPTVADTDSTANFVLKLSGFADGDYLVYIDDRVVQRVTSGGSTGFRYEQYSYNIKDNKVMGVYADGNIVADYKPGGQNLILNGVYYNGYTDTAPVPLSKFTSGPHKIRVGDGQSCSASFTVEAKAKAAEEKVTNCEISFTNSSFTPVDSITVQAVNPATQGQDPKNERRIILSTDAAGNNKISTDQIGNSNGMCTNKGALETGVNIGTVSTGTYTVIIAQSNSCQFSLGEKLICQKSFKVVGVGQLGGGPINSDKKNDAAVTPLPPPCAEYIKDSEGNERCGSVKTGLGINIGTDLDSFIKAVFSFLLGFAGGIAILLIMVSGYRIATSQGDAEVLKNAREQITAAVVGLIFVVFSLVILQIIGVNILNIPGFGK